jgi:hypothetical protein
MSLVLVDELGESLAVGLRIRDYDGELRPIVHEFLQHLTGEARSQTEKIGAEVRFRHDEPTVP